MKQFFFFFFFFSFLISHFSFSQDIHFSQFNASPLNLNPALAGVFNGNYRFAANYKNQWHVLTGYETFAVSADAGLGKGNINGKDFVGAGLSFFSDKAGDSKLSTTQINLTGSYNKAFDRDGKQYLAFGIQAGYVMKSINYGNLSWDNQWDASTNSYNQSSLSGEENAATNTNYIDLSAGLLWYYIASKKFNVNAGLSVSHLSAPNQSFYDQGAIGETLPAKIGFHIGSQAMFSEKVKLLPSILYLRQGPYQEIDLGTFLRYQLSSNINELPALYLGAWYRLGDAAVIVLRMDFSVFSLGISYDVNVSNLSKYATSSQGGPEISLIAIIKSQESQNSRNKISSPGF